MEMKAILISIFANNGFNLDYATEIDEEMRLLSLSCGIELLNKDRIIIKYNQINPKTFFSKGKVEEINNFLNEYGDFEYSLILNIDFSPTQIRNCEQIFNKRIITKTQLIYQIFLARANSKPAKIQLELANLKYIKSMLAGSYGSFDRIRGGIGLKGPGETKLEVDRRTISKKINSLKKQLLKIEKHLVLQVKNRENQFIFPLVGYTNAGKTSLLNILTKADQYSDDLLFSTLNVKSRQAYLQDNKKIIISDTIGFIRQLPIHLIESFKTTLLEIKYSSLLGIVIDSSSKFYHEHIEVVESMLKSLNCEDIPKIFIFNKIDLLTDSSLEMLKFTNDSQTFNNPKKIFYLSTKTKEGVDELIKYLIEISENSI